MALLESADARRETERESPLLAVATSSTLLMTSRLKTSVSPRESSSRPSEMINTLSLTVLRTPSPAPSSSRDLTITPSPRLRTPSETVYAQLLTPSKTRPSSLELDLSKSLLGSTL